MHCPLRQARRRVGAVMQHLMQPGTVWAVGDMATALSEMEHRIAASELATRAEAGRTNPRDLPADKSASKEGGDAIIVEADLLYAPVGHSAGGGQEEGDSWRRAAVDGVSGLKTRSPSGGVDRKGGRRGVVWGVSGTGPADRGARRGEKRMGRSDLLMKREIEEKYRSVRSATGRELYGRVLV